MQKMNKKAFSIRDFIPALIIFALVSGLFYLMIGAEGNNYSRPDIVDSKFNEHYNNLNDLASQVNSMYNVSNPKTNPGGFELLGAFGTVFKAMIGVIGIIFDSLFGLNTQFSYIATDFGIPSVISFLVLPAILAILTVIIVLIVLNASKFGRL